MSNAWPLVPLREVLTPISRPEPVDSQTTYRILGAHWYAGGLYIKDTKTGALIQADKVYRVKQEDFVYNRLFAWKGSFAIATAENHGCYVSNEFPCFTLNKQRVDGQYLWRYFGQQSVWDEALGESTGGTPTSRNRLKEEKLLSMEVPLPPIDEQRCIVTRIKELAAKIEEARGLRRQAVEEAGSLVPAGIHSTFSNLREGEKRALSEVVEIANGQGLNGRDRDQSGKYDVYGSGGQVGTHSAAVSTGPFIVIGRKGSAGKATYAPNGGWVTDTAYSAFPRNTNELSCKFLFHAIQSLDFSQDIITTAIPGINRTAIYRHQIPVPTVEEQLYIEDYLDGLQAKIDVLKRLQAETAAELDALLPSVLDKAFCGEL